MATSSTLIVRAVIYASLFSAAALSAVAQELNYPRGEKFPRPTAAQLDTLLVQGIVPKPLEAGVLRPMYWPRAAFLVEARATSTKYMTQALEGGIGLEGQIALPLGPSDHGAYVFGRASDFRVHNRGWLGWQSATGPVGTAYMLGVGAAWGVPLRSPQFSIPLSMSAGAVLFQTPGGTAAETYVGFEPGLGVRFRALPAVAITARAHPAWMLSVTERVRSVGAWGFSLAVEVAPVLRPHRPLQAWAPPLVVNAQDVVRLLTTEIVSPLNVLDRNLDFINTELKPVTAFGWYDLGFYGEVRGTVMASSRASSGNVTALDIRIDSADRRGFRVTRTASVINPVLAEQHRETGATPDSGVVRTDSAVIRRIERGDYAYRPGDELGLRYVRVEVFPLAKGPLELIPRTGSRVVIRGDIRWDGDGHMELHPRKASDIRVVVGEFLDSDDPIGLE